MRVHGAKLGQTPRRSSSASGRITFAELDARSSQAAQAFRAAGVGFGDRVAFIEKNGAEFFEVVCGLAKLGAVGVPVNWRLAAPEMLHIIEDAGPRVVVVGSEFFGHLEAIEDRLTSVEHHRGDRSARPLAGVRGLARPAIPPRTPASQRVPTTSPS